MVNSFKLSMFGVHLKYNYIFFFWRKKTQDFLSVYYKQNIVLGARYIKIGETQLLSSRNLPFGKEDTQTTITHHRKHKVAKQKYKNVLRNLEDKVLLFTGRKNQERVDSRISCCGSAVTNWQVSMRMRVQFLASLSGLRIWCCHDLWRRLQTWFRFFIAVLWRRPAAAAPIHPLAWKLPYAMGVALKRKKKKRERERDNCNIPMVAFSSHWEHLLVGTGPPSSTSYFQRFLLLIFLSL